MNKVIEINTSKLSDDDTIDLDFDISSYLIDLDVRHSVSSFGNRLVFIIEDIDVIIYNRFINFLKNKNLDFKEV